MSLSAVDKISGWMVTSILVQVSEDGRKGSPTPNVSDRPSLSIEMF